MKGFRLCPKQDGGKRFEQRLAATYGIEHNDQKGYVYDIAPFGLFLSGDRFYQPDTRLKIKIELDNGKLVQFEGQVCWGKLPERPDWFDRGAGMGIKISRFLEGELVYQDYVQKLCSIHHKATTTASIRSGLLVKSPLFQSVYL